MAADIFWISWWFIIYTYLLYPVVLFLITLFFTKPLRKGEIFPKISVLISVYNEEKFIEPKINNCLTLDYPADNLETIIGSDGSSDNTNSIMEKLTSNRVIFKKWDHQRGKVSVLNDLMRFARGEIIVFSDARQMLEKNAIKELVCNFNDETIGCVSGELKLISNKHGSIGEGVILYWEYEKFLRSKESRISSMLGATGAIYAIRKNLYCFPPSNILLDDVYIPFKIIEQGYRAVFEPKSLAYDTVVDDARQEFKRKVRTLAGNWQAFFCFKNLFNPFKSQIAFQLISHKLLRVLMPFFLVAMFTTNIFLLDFPVYDIFLLGQIIFYILALIGFIPNVRLKGLFQIPYTFLVLNLAALVGLYSFSKNKQSVTWKR